jgi:transposase-like protein
MSKSTSERSAVAFADPESFVRGPVQAFIQSVLGEEVEELLGGRKSERRQTSDPVGYRNGHGEERRLTTTSIGFSWTMGFWTQISCQVHDGLRARVSC